jgi:hypothetical protein
LKLTDAFENTRRRFFFFSFCPQPQRAEGLEIEAQDTTTGT